MVVVVFGKPLHVGQRVHQVGTRSVFPPVGLCEPVPLVEGVVPHGGGRVETLAQALADFLGVGEHNMSDGLFFVKGGLVLGEPPRKKIIRAFTGDGVKQLGPEIGAVDTGVAGCCGHEQSEQGASLGTGEGLFNNLDRRNHHFLAGNRSGMKRKEKRKDETGEEPEGKKKGRRRNKKGTEAER